MFDLKQLPFGDPIVASISDLNPLKQGTNCCRMFTTLADSFPDMLGENERRRLHEELRRYDVWKPSVHIEYSFEHDTDSGVKTSLKVSADQYCNKVSEVKIGCTFEFRFLVKLSPAMPCIRHGNVESEQICSRISLAKNKFRSRMTGNILNGVLTVNFNVKENCYSFIPSARNIEKAKHPRQYKQCNSDVESEQ